MYSRRFFVALNVLALCLLTQDLLTLVLILLQCLFRVISHVLLKIQGRGIVNKLKKKGLVVNEFKWMKCPGWEVVVRVPSTCVTAEDMTHVGNVGNSC